jgi:hypothetical protein
MKRTTNKSSSKSSSKKVKYTVNPNSNVIMTDKHQNSEVNIISDPKEPFFKFEFKNKEQ